MKASIIGAGTWGTALGILLAHNGHEVTIWSKFQQEVDALQKTHRHKNLPGAVIPESMCFSSDLEAALKDQELVVLAVPSIFVRATAHEMKPYVGEGQVIVSVAKGIEIGGATKNVIALAAGMADGLGYGDNTKAALITRGIAEIERLGVKMGCRMETFPIASRRYQVLRVDVTGSDPLLAIHTQLPDETVSDIYRIILTGEIDQSPDLNRLYDALSELFFELQLRDETRLRRSVWERAGDDTLRGLFLMKLKKQFDAAGTEEQRLAIEQAARWGLAALDKREEVVKHEDQ